MVRLRRRLRDGADKARQHQQEQRPRRLRPRQQQERRREDRDQVRRKPVTAIREGVVEDVKQREEPEEEAEQHLPLRQIPRRVVDPVTAHQEQRQPPPRPQRRIDRPAHRRRGKDQPVQLVEKPRGRRHQRQRIGRIRPTEPPPAGFHHHPLVKVEPFAFQLRPALRIAAQVHHLDLSQRLAQPDHLHVAAAERAIPVIEDRGRHQDPSFARLGSKDVPFAISSQTSSKGPKSASRKVGCGCSIRTPSRSAIPKVSVSCPFGT